MSGQQVTVGRILYFYTNENENAEPLPFYVTQVHSPSVVSGVVLDAFRLPVMQAETSVELRDSPVPYRHVRWMPYQVAAAKQYPVTPTPTPTT